VGWHPAQLERGCCSTSHPRTKYHSAARRNWADEPVSNYAACPLVLTKNETPGQSKGAAGPEGPLQLDTHERTSHTPPAIAHWGGVRRRQPTTGATGPQEARATTKRMSPRPLQQGTLKMPGTQGTCAVRCTHSRQVRHRAQDAQQLSASRRPSPPLKQRFSSRPTTLLPARARPAPHRKKRQPLRRWWCSSCTAVLSRFTSFREYWRGAGNAMDLAALK